MWVYFTCCSVLVSEGTPVLGLTIIATLYLLPPLQQSQYIVVSMCVCVRAYMRVCMYMGMCVCGGGCFV